MISLINPGLPAHFLNVRITILLCIPVVAFAQRPPLEEAYRALAARAYDEAIAAFREAVRRGPDRASIRKDLAYTYLKTGETEFAREQFAAAMKIDGADLQAALEYAFLCFETKQRAEARRTFDRIRKTRREPASTTAEQAFQNIDRELKESIERWQAALVRSPGNHSAAVELARLAGEKDDLALAAESYRRALALKPDDYDLLIDLARVLRQGGRESEAGETLSRARKCPSARVAELAREMAPWLAAPPGSPGPKQMGFRSYDAGYMQDAVRYLRAAHEADPSDGEVALKLGWTYNVLKDDAEAVRWFDLARRSKDPLVAGEAARAYRNLQPPGTRFRTTAWFFPFYSSRWSDAFGYAQVKSEIRIGGLPVRPYVSLRLIGDTRRNRPDRVAQYLSESAFVPALGISASPARGVTVWAEAGASIGYWVHARPVSRVAGDFRGGTAISRGYGSLLGGEEPGLFAETNNDIVFISRFNRDVIGYSQNRFGYTLRSRGALQAQVLWNANVTQDVRREYWADFVESGPGIRWRLRSWPPPLVVSASVLRGAFTRNEGNPRRPNFFDVRVGFWYAFTR